MLRCAIYTRQSSVPHHGDTSCEFQFDACLSLVKARAGIGWTWVGTRFDDPGFSGATMDRPGLQRLTESVEHDEIDVVIVEYLDRLSRSVYQTLQILELFRKHNVAVSIVSCQDFTISPSDNFMINLMASFAEFERDLMSERIREARAALKRHGLRVGGALPYGYTTPLGSTQLVTVEKEAERVRRMFTWAAEGKTPSQIAAMANSRHWRTKVRQARRTGNQTGGKLWTARAVLYLLSNPTYTGCIRDGEAWRDGVHEAIISEELFTTVRQAIEDRRRSHSRTNGRPHTPLLFRDKAFCARCGKKLGITTTKKGPVIYRYYRCRNKRCGGGLASAGQIEFPMFDLLGKLDVSVCEPDATEKQREYLENFSFAWRVLPDDLRWELITTFISKITVNPKTGLGTAIIDCDAIEEWMARNPEHV